MVSIIFFKDRFGTIWLGTHGGGLNKMERWKNEHTGEITTQFTHYTTRDGLPDDDVSCIEEDEYGNLWIGTPKGLSKFIQKTEDWQ